VRRVTGDEHRARQEEVGRLHPEALEGVGYRYAVDLDVDRAFEPATIDVLAPNVEP
jgi:hypothetical protein